ncbi:MAG: sterol desaturase family protein [Proteobacteria bacterium]|nr:sterol desaturase family protein [Pseudomonadota bacterium]
MQVFMLEYGETLQVVLFFSLLPALLALERVLPFRRPEPDSARLRTNFALTALAIACMPLVPVSFITAAFWAQERGLGLFNYLNLSEPALIAATLFVRAFISFGTHFLNHKIPWLWRLHRVHHIDTELDVSSTVRFHPLEMPVGAMIGVPAVVVFGLSPWVLS